MPSSRRATKLSAKLKDATGELLLEIGTEELPYQFVAPALASLTQRAELLLKEHRLAWGSVRALGTPRRLVLVVASLRAYQDTAVREVQGPSKAVAFDASGQPTKAALGFAASQGVPVGELEVRQTPKGDYVFVVKREEGAATLKVLGQMLPGLIEELSFPKAMRWNETGVRFARPVRWILALYGRKPVVFKAAGLTAGTRTWGHRFVGTPKASRQGVGVSDFRSYMKVLQHHGVVPDQDRRRTLILSQIERLAASAKAVLHRDDELLEQAVYTAEQPHAIVGSFNPQYLSLPKEILMTAMKEHQGYFSLLRKKDGSLLPQFISVTNMKLSSMRLIQRGNERVLAARLADAKFFFDEDRKTKLWDRVDKLEQVVFHHKLGTLHQKTNRVMELASFLAYTLAGHDFVASCRRAAQLSKADLLTGIVGEFPTLQGIMGGEYARHDGETMEVSQAIAEQYLPRAMDGEIPKSLAGQILSLADRLDTIVAFFHAGLIPSGSEDPYALRRHASAVVRILIEGNLTISLDEALVESRRLIEEQDFKGAEQAKPGEQRAGAGDPLEFIVERLRYYGRTTHNLRDDVMDAILKSPSRASLRLDQLIVRMKELQIIASRPEFDPLMVGFKRAHRLIDKEGWGREHVDPGLFQHPSEEGLYKALHDARVRLPRCIEQGGFSAALELLVGMKPAIDGFFVGVMVNAEDEALRANRLSLLCAVDRLFMELADFSQIAVHGV